MLNFAILLALLVIGSNAAVNVHREVYETLRNGNTANIWVQLPNKKFNPVAPEHLSQISGRDNRRLAHFKIMTEYANAMQAPLESFLQQKRANFKKFWITNAFVIYDADIETVRAIEMQFPVVEEIYIEQMASIEIPVQQQVEEQAQPNEKNLAGWNIEQTNAPSAWALGYDGRGFVLGNIDTGVRHTHEALRANYRGTIEGTNDYNWHDPRGATVPFDNNGHGTHVMGTMAGSLASGIGMAYGATWIAAKGCASSSCSQADLTSSGEFMAAPTDTAGRNPQPLRAPDVVQNSWGGSGGQTWFHPIVDSWLALDIVPSFSAGNSGPGCGTIGSPSDYRYSISVASNDQSRALSSFSSRGAGETPGNNATSTPWTLQKPDISGPGSSIRSAWNTGDSAYNTISGTSMSGPHIAASAALILGPFSAGGPCPSANATSCKSGVDCLCVEYFRKTATSTASNNYQPPGGVGPTTCDGVSYQSIPNYHYGYGILDVRAALNVAMAAARQAAQNQ